MNEMYNIANSEQLYLLKEGKNEIYVNNCQLLQQHQIDALRFLYKQFHRKKPGVIINFPPTCGKSVTVALFINAIQSLLRKPALILCNHDEEMQNWKELFLKWTEYNDETIAVEHLNPLVKDKKIFLKKPVMLNSYLRRCWSVIIIKEDVVSKDILKLVFDADFKIWITSTDVKKDLSFLSNVYKWLYPKSKINISDFETKENHPREKFAKSIQLDSFLEDIAIRKYINLQSFETVKNFERSLVEIETNERKRPKKSLKNKDATGTKIKRSKRILNDDDILLTTPNRNESVINHNENENDFVINNQNVNEMNNEIGDCDRSNDNDSPKLDVESFIRDQKPLAVTQFDFYDISRLYDNRESKIEYQNNCLSKTLIKNIQEQSTESLSFDDDYAVDLNEVQDSKNKSEFSFNQNNNNEIENIQNEDKTLHSIDLKEHELIKIVSDIEINKEINVDSNEIKSNNVTEKKKNANIQNEEETLQTASDLKAPGLGKTNSDNEEKIDVNVNNKMKSDESYKDIDFKVSEMEEKALKKFKGTILDSIF